MVALIWTSMRWELQVIMGWFHKTTLRVVAVLLPCAVMGMSSAEAVSEYEMNLQEVEKDVQELKEKVFRSKATLALLREIMVQGSSSGSRLKIWHVNRLGRGYTIESVSYFVDGQATYSKFKTDQGTDELDQIKEVAVFDGPLTPGNHHLSVQLILRGTGFGVFTYVQEMEFTVTQQQEEFEAKDGQSCSVRFVADERLWVRNANGSRQLADYKSRPNVTIEPAQCSSLTRVEGEAAE